MPRSGQPAGRVRRVLARENLLVLTVATYVVGLLNLLPYQLQQDGWLTLVAGRSVAQDGLPRTDHLTVLAHGAQWIDQQWLAQLGFYAAAAVGGVKLALLLHGALVAAALALAIVAARRLGGSQRAVAWIALVALPTIAVCSWQMRAQSFAYVLFIAVLWLLIEDARAPSRRVFLVVVPLVLWANVHGSVVLGVGLVCLRALTLAVARERGRARRPGRAAALSAAAVACLLASPYGLSLVTYYERTLLNAQFGRFVAEWARTTPGPLTAAFFLLAFAAVWIVARHGRVLTVFERLALLFTMTGGLLAIRNMVWFAVAAVIIVPAALAQELGPEATQAPNRLRLAVTMAACGLAAVALVVAALRAPASYEAHYPRALAGRLAGALKAPATRVFADLRYADWLLWKHPELAGRVAYDTRLELLSDRELSSAATFIDQTGGRWKDVAAGYDVVVLDRASDPSGGERAPTYRELLADRGTRLAYLDDRTAMLVRP